MAGTQGPKVDDILAEIDLVADSLELITARTPASPPTEGEVWPIYARTEKAVAKLHYRMGTERPGVFSVLPKSKRPEELLRLALAELKEASLRIREGRFADGLESLRSARTNLRGFLADALRVRRREKRLASLSRRSSSSSS